MSVESRPDPEDVFTREEIEDKGLDDEASQERFNEPEGHISPELRRFGRPRFDLLTTHLFNIASFVDYRDSEEDNDAGVIQKPRPSGGWRDAKGLHQDFQSNHKENPVFIHSNLLSAWDSDVERRAAYLRVAGDLNPYPVTLWTEKELDSRVDESDAEFPEESLEALFAQLERNYAAVPGYIRDGSVPETSPISLVRVPEVELVSTLLEGKWWYGNPVESYREPESETVSEFYSSNGFAISVDLSEHDPLAVESEIEDGSIVVKVGKVGGKGGKVVYDSQEYGGELENIDFDELENELVPISEMSESDIGDEEYTRNGAYELIVF